MAKYLLTSPKIRENKLIINDIMPQGTFLLLLFLIVIAISMLSSHIV